ncbi:MAG: hypothetical protein MZV49_09680 [Rhodopseudomonas palustris]|nr:hypothetical protein [Rhodopseudomonas palustris]
MAFGNLTGALPRAGSRARPSRPGLTPRAVRLEEPPRQHPRRGAARPGEP